MALTEKIRVVIDVVADQATTSFQTFRKSITEAEGAGNKFKAGTSSAFAAVKANAGLMAVGAGTALIGFGAQVFEAGTKLEAMDAKARTVFGADNIGRVNKWADANAGAFGITTTEATAAAAAIGDLLVPMGFTKEAATDQALALVDLSGALAAWSGGQYDAAEVSQILAKAMLGEREQLKSLGISITEADVSARLLANGQSKLTGAALAQAKAMATQQLIVEKSTDAQRAWSDGSMNATKQANENKASMAQLAETITRSLYPAVEALVPLITDTTEALEPMVKLAASVVGAVGDLQELGRSGSPGGGNFLGSMPEVLDAFWYNISDPENAMDDFFGNIKGAVSEVATFGANTELATRNVNDFHGGAHRAAVRASELKTALDDSAEAARAHAQRVQEADYAWQNFLDTVDEERAVRDMGQALMDAAAELAETGTVAQDTKDKLIDMANSGVASGNLLAAANFKVAIDTSDIALAIRLYQDLLAIAGLGGTVLKSSQMVVGAGIRNLQEGRDSNPTPVAPPKRATSGARSGVESFGNVTVYLPPATPESTAATLRQFQLRNGLL